LTVSAAAAAAACLRAQASAIGKNMTNAKTFLEKRYNDEMGLEDAVHTSLLTLKEGFEGQVSGSNIEVRTGGEAGILQACLFAGTSRGRQTGDVCGQHTQLVLRVAGCECTKMTPPACHSAST
jgi:hypothetical protein